MHSVRYDQIANQSRRFDKGPPAQPAKKHQRDYEHLLLRFANERILYRLSLSAYRDQFILKGAMMLNVWLDEPYRPTRDVDVLGTRDLGPADGLRFDPDSIKTDTIRDQDDFGGLRLTFTGFLGQGRIPLAIDVGYGDSVVPAAERRALPVLLDFPAPTLLTYPPESSVSEKFEAIVKLGASNSRIKDYCDIWMLRDLCDEVLLPKAIAATFKRRKRAIPTETPNGLRMEYTKDPARLSQWQMESNSLLHRPASFEQLIAEVAAFIMPQASAARALHGSTDSATNP